ncbi:MAG: phosphoenolpyruvate synthase [Anaerolineae bacterium]|nr:phosphoenolpyruvate synthase [Anaerolineae bacterium]
MTLQYILSLSDAQSTLEIVGGKGASLARLTQAGLPVPGGFHVTTAAYKQFVAESDLQPRILAALQSADASQPATLETASRAIEELFTHTSMPPAIADEIRTAYLALSDPTAQTSGEQSESSQQPNLPVAVRSSATAEDLPGLSFAGQQETFLNIHGVAALLDAVKRCWASLWTARAIGYRLQHGIDQEAVSLAVVVQELVFADAAGVLFTANPINGQRDQAMITATWGLGEAIVGGMVTPDTLIVEKATGKVLSRETADKQVMTLRLPDGTTEQPTPEPLRHAQVLSDEQASELTRMGTQIEHLYGMPMDIEWTLSGGTFAIVQARPITALPESQEPLSIEWKPPNPKGQYMRGSVVDIMPDPLSPLFATLGLPAVGRYGIKEVMRVLTRSEPQMPDNYIMTINDYAYMSVDYTPRQWWWVSTRMLISYPRLLNKSISLWRDDIRPRYAAAAARWQDRLLESLSPSEIWAGVQEINNAAMLHLSALLVATTGASAGSELLFTKVYEKLIHREGDPAATTFLMGYNSTPIQAEKSLYDLAAWVQTQPELATAILDTPATDLVRMCAAPSSPAWQTFGERLQAHLRAFGHIIYDLDFAKALPLDDPTPMLETVKMYLSGRGASPHERQKELENRRIQATAAVLQRLKGLKSWAFRKSLKWAQSLAEIRESALSDIGLGYPALRRMLRELGERLVAAGAIARPDDIYWLECAELEPALTALERGDAIETLAQRVEQRIKRWRALKQVTPPPTLPPRKRYLGIDMSAFTPATAESQTGDTLKGVAASAGKVTAPARVLHGPEDFGQMQPGNVLIATTTTPAWTPLFAMASAIVTDIGGPLSHGSIVAREYGIPAVMGTGVATKRIQNGQMITVDGNTGVVTLTGQ